MATYTPRYDIYYNSSMRDKRLYRVTIEERDYQGVASRKVLYSTPDGFTLVRGARDAAALNPIVASDLTMRIKVVDDTDLKVLYSDDPSKYRVTLYIVEDSISKVVWSGFIATGVYSQPFAKPPYTVVINATDGYDILRSMKFENDGGVRYTGVWSLKFLMDHLTRPLESYQPLQLWGMESVEVSQSGDTAELIGIPMARIYAAFDNEVPTYYDVLERVLQNFCLQIHQRYGSGFSVRPVFALNDNKRPSWRTLSASLPVLSGDDGVGLSSAATLSMQSPLRSIEATNGRADVEDFTISGISEPTEWQTFIFQPTKAFYANVANGTKGVRFRCRRYEDPTGKWVASAWWFFELRETFRPISATMRWQFDIYNLSRSACTIGILLYAMDADKDVAEWAMPTGSDFLQSFNFPEGTFFLHPTSGEWVNVGGLTLSHDELRSWAHEKSMSAGELSLPFGVRRKLPEEASASYTATMVGIPQYGNKPIKMGVMMLPVSFFVENIEMIASPVTIEYDNGTGLVAHNGSGVRTINAVGSGAEVFAQYFAERGAAPALEGTFASGVVRVDSGEVLAGYVSPAEGCTMLDVATLRMRQLRGLATQKLEGEYYHPKTFDLDTIWIDGSYRYYATYIEENTRRGLANVQLCQLPSKTQRVFDGVAMSNAKVAFDTTIIFARNGELLWLDIITGREVVLATFAGTPYVKKGVGVACVLDLVDEPVLTAYDEDGAILSRITDIWASVVRPSSPLEEVLMLSNAFYDKSISTWTLIGNVDGSTDTIRISMLDEYGVLVNTTVKNSGRVVGSIIPFVGGFGYQAMPLTSTQATFYWYSYILNEWPKVVTYGAVSEVVRVTDFAILIQQSDGVLVVYREDMRVSGSSKIANAVYVDANNSCVLVRGDTEDSTTYRSVDLRSMVTTTRIINADNIPCLVGDKIVYERAGNLTIVLANNI